MVKCLFNFLAINFTRDLRWDQVSNNFQASSREQTAPWVALCAQEQKAQMWQLAQEAPLSSSDNSFSTNPAWLWAGEMCHLGCSAHLEVLCCLLLQAALPPHLLTHGIGLSAALDVVGTQGDALLQM